MVTHAKRGGDAIVLRQSLFENRVPANGIWETEGIQMQQRYDKSRRPEPGRPLPHRRQRIQTVPDRGKKPVPAEDPWT